MIHRLYTCIFLCLIVLPGSLVAQEEIVLDRIIASVDGEPITLSEVREILPASSDTQVSDVSDLPGFRTALDQLINEKLLTLESEARRIRVSAKDVERYVENVAAHNNLSLEEFSAALENEGKDIEQFRRSVRIEILRSRLASSLMEEGGGVTQAEVDAYIQEQYGARESGDTQIQLRQVLVREDRNGIPKENVCAEVAEKFASGTPFEELARDFSDSPEATKGGDLGLLAEKDLNPVISEAIATVDAGEISPVTSSPLGCHVFFVEERFDSKKDTEQLEQEVRARLNRQKLEEKFQTYFVSEIYKNHTIEKKI